MIVCKTNGAESRNSLLWQIYQNSRIFTTLFSQNSPPSSFLAFIIIRKALFLRIIKIYKMKDMSAEFYKSKVDWWVPAVVVFTSLVACIGPLIDGEVFWVGIFLGIWLAIMEIVMFASVKYQICDGKLGIRNILYKWEWFPIEKITEVKKTSGILAGAALSTKRVAIKFSDRSILKSSQPLEISPKNRDAFIARIKEINPNIELK